MDRNSLTTQPFSTDETVALSTETSAVETAPNSATHPLSDKTTDQAFHLAETHPDFIDALSSGPIACLPELDPRKYQADCLEALRQGYLNGTVSGSAEIGTGGGKTAIALNFISQIPGKVLWLAPSNAALARALDECETLGLNKKIQVLNGKKPAMESNLVFSTVGMINYGEKFRQFATDEFALIIFDEGHHSMGKATMSMLSHFEAYKLFLTATPEMSVKHLDQVATPLFRYTSEDLIKNDQYPFWVLRRYEVTGEKLDQARVIGDNYALAEGEEVEILNMPHRYAIALRILEQNIETREKTIVFLPSVQASRKFVEEIVAAKPSLKGKVAHVDGKMDKRMVREIAHQLRLGNLLAVCCNDLFTESLDVPDLKHVVLGDPCCSPRVLMQRIGRGARPARGKTHLTIHDVISTVPNLQTKISGTAPLTVAAALGTRRYTPDIVLNGPHKDKVLFQETSANTTGSNIRFVENTEFITEDIPFQEKMLEMTFLSDPATALGLIKMFAVMHQTAPQNLLLRPDYYSHLHAAKPIRLAFPDGHFSVITLAETLAAIKIYGITPDLLDLAAGDYAVISNEIRKKVTNTIQPSKTHSSAFIKETPSLTALCNLTSNIKAARLPNLRGKMDDLIEDILTTTQVYHFQRLYGSERELERRQNRADCLAELEELLPAKHPDFLVWQGLREYLQRSRQNHSNEKARIARKTYPFRLAKQKGISLLHKDVQRELDLCQHEWTKQDLSQVNDELICKMLEKPDVYFAYLADLYPQIGFYLRAVIHGILKGLPVLYFKPQHLKKDPQNLLLFLGTMCGDHQFLWEKNPWPEAWIDTIKMTNGETLLAVNLEHLRPT